MTYLDAAEKRLRECQRPMTARELADDSVALGRLMPRGTKRLRTDPRATMGAILGRDIDRFGATSRFTRSGGYPFRYSLRVW